MCVYTCVYTCKWQQEPDNKEPQLESILLAASDKCEYSQDCSTANCTCALPVHVHEEYMHLRDI